MSNYECLEYSVANSVATITLNNPSALNAISQQMRFDLLDVVAKVEADEVVRIVIVTGAGRAFCAGADLTEGMPGHDNFISQCATEYLPWLMAIHNSSKLYIAAVNGACAGIGTALVMNCDLVVMADDAYLYLAFSAIGLMPDGGANWLLLQKLGYQRALEMAVNAGKLTAQECAEVGIANKVVTADQLLAEATAFAEELAQGPPLAQAATKQLMRKALNMSYEEVVTEEAVQQNALIESEDARNAVQAFLTKQKAVFKGR